MCSVNVYNCTKYPYIQTFGPVPMSVPVPPIFAEYATASSSMVLNNEKEDEKGSWIN